MCFEVTLFITCVCLCDLMLFRWTADRLWRSCAFIPGSSAFGSSANQPSRLSIWFLSQSRLSSGLIVRPARRKWLY